MSVMMPWTKRSDDELISAYIDGQMDDATRQTFEARINTDPVLRQRVDTSRALIRASRQLPRVDVPRNFTLPRTATTVQRRDSSPPHLWWRVGSALAAAVFVIAIGLDTIGMGQLAQAPAPAPAAAPRAAQSFAAKAPAPTQQNATESAKAAQDATGVAANQTTAAAAAPAATSAPAVREPSASPRLMGGGAANQTTAAPEVTKSPAAAQLPTAAAAPTEAMNAPGTPTIEASELPAAKIIAATGTPEIVPHPQAAAGTTATPTVGAEQSRGLTLQAMPKVTATVVSTRIAPVETVVPAQAPLAQPDVDILRVTALIALVIAVVTGVIGWIRR
jgi:hypothetical protein